MYIVEKDQLIGFFIGAISYGIAVALFCKCMGVLLRPIGRSMKLALVVHTVALFLFLTIPVGIDLNYLSMVYIDIREFPGNHKYPPGPIGSYEMATNSAAGIVSDVMFPLNQWLADGLLLHRCYVVYSMNHWIMAFPSLMYFASIVLGIAHVYNDPGLRYFAAIEADLTIAYYTITLSLNVILTLMIIVRLILHARGVRKAIGTSDGSGTRLHTVITAVVTTLIETYALYAVALLVFIVPWAIVSPVAHLFGAVGMVQVIAPYLIILRVAKRRAVTSESISGTTGSIRFQSQGSMDGGGSFADGDSMEANGEAPGEPHVWNENAIEEVPL